MEIVEPSLWALTDLVRDYPPIIPAPVHFSGMYHIFLKNRFFLFLISASFSLFCKIEKLAEMITRLFLSFVPSSWSTQTGSESSDAPSKFLVKTPINLCQRLRRLSEYFSSCLVLSLRSSPVTAHSAYPFEVLFVLMHLQSLRFPLTGIQSINSDAQIYLQNIQ